MTKKGLKILQVIQSMGKGGAERYAADLSIALSSAGHEVNLVSFEDRNAYKFLTDQIDYRVIKTFVQPSITSHHIFHTDEFDEFVEEFQPDIIHSHLFKTEIASRNTVLPNTTYITSCQNNMPEFQNWNLQKALRKITYTRLYEKRWMIRRYRACMNNFIAISNDTEQYYKKSLPGDLAANVTMIHHAINYSRFAAVNHDRSETIDRINLIYIARYVPIKNHTFLMDVMVHLKKRGRPVSLTLLGEGAEMTRVQKKARDLGVAENVIFAGNVDNVESYLKKANVYVHPAVYEPFGLVLIEAMAAGLPVVCLDGKGNRDLINDGENGYMLFQTDPKMFAEKILELISDKDLYRKISTGASIYASAFSMESHVEQIETFYRNCIENRSLSKL